MLKFRKTNKILFVPIAVILSLFITVTSFAQGNVSCTRHTYNDEGICTACGNEFQLQNVKKLNNVSMICVKNNAPINVRPYESSTVIGYCVLNDEYIVVESVTNMHGNTWYKTKSNGWILSSYLENKKECTHNSYDNEGYCTVCKEEFKLKDVKDLSNVVMVCKKDNGYFHKRPYDASEIKGTAIRGNEYTVIQSAKNSHGNTWYMVKDGTWIYSDFLEARQVCTHPTYNTQGFCTKCGAEFTLTSVKALNNITVKCIKDNVTLHSRPYPESSVTAKAYTGDKFIAVQSAKNYFGKEWYKLSNGSWVDRQNVTETTEKIETPQQGTGLEYNPTLAVDYANKNYNTLSQNVLSAEFVYNCIKAGGIVPADVHVPGYQTPKNLATYLQKIGFKEVKLEVTNLGSSYEYLNKGKNSGNISLGDIILYRCESQICGTRTYKHIAIVTKIDNATGKVYVTSHNPNAKDVLISNYTDGKHDFAKTKDKVSVYCYHYNGKNSLVKVSSPQRAAQGVISLNVDGKDVSFTDQKPVLKNGYTLLPVRDVSEAIGQPVFYDDVTKKVTIGSGKKQMILTIGSYTVDYTENGSMKTGTLNLVPVIINGRTMLPVRDIVEYFGYDIVWDDYTKTIFI